MSSPAQTEEKPVRSLIPVRMDKMPWSRFHWMVIFGLGTAWILDGLEIQIVASAGYAKDLGMSDAQVGFTATVYLLGTGGRGPVLRPADGQARRKRLFIITLLVYLIGSGIAGLSPNMWFLWVFRFVAGAGIGGEYSAINSAIDALMPGKYRGRVDLAINGTYWARRDLGPWRALCSTPSAFRREHRLADGLLHRSGAPPVHHLPAPAHPGEPARGW